MQWLWRPTSVRGVVGVWTVPRKLQTVKGDSPLLPERPAGVPKEGSCPLFFSVCYFDRVAVLLERGVCRLRDVILASALDSAKPERGDCGSAPFPQAVAQEVVEFRNCVDLFDGAFHRVAHTAELDQIVADYHIAGQRVAVPRLTDTANVDHGFVVVQSIAVADFGGIEKSAVLCKHTPARGCAPKTDAGNEAEHAGQFPGIVDVFRKDVLVQRVAGNRARTESSPAGSGAAVRRGIPSGEAVRGVIPPLLQPVAASKRWLVPRRC